MKGRDEEEGKESIQDLAEFGGSDLGFGGVHNAINDFARDSPVENLAEMRVNAHPYLRQDEVLPTREHLSLSLSLSQERYISLNCFP